MDHRCQRPVRQSAPSACHDGPAPPRPFQCSLPARCDARVPRTATRTASADASLSRPCARSDAPAAIKNPKAAGGPVSRCAPQPNGHGPDRGSSHGPGRESTPPSTLQPSPVQLRQIDRIPTVRLNPITRLARLAKAQPRRNDAQVRSTAAEDRSRTDRPHNKIPARHLASPALPPAA